MEDVQRLLSVMEEQWPQLRSYQIVEQGNYWRGAFELPDPSIPGMIEEIEAGLPRTVPLYCHPESNFYRDTDLLKRIEEQVDYLLRIQLSSGCISLVNCNIDSPPDTGFSVHHAAMSYHALKTASFPEAQAVADKLERYLRQTVPCLLTGGIHTPNHRWVICGALALLYEIVPDERLRQRADEYLSEGLDVNDSGEWTERSNAIYNAVCCNFLFHAARVFGYDDLMGAIEENLTMMKYMLHPDGAIVTEYSSRQDRGETIRLSDDYYIAFKIMASHTRNAEFHSMAAEALKHSNSGVPLLYLMRFPHLIEDTITAAPLPQSYELMLNEGHTAPVSGVRPFVRTSMHAGSPLVRYRDGDLSVTIVSGQPEFLFIQYGKARMPGLRWSFGWFGIAGAPMASLEKLGSRSYELSIELEGFYEGPLEGASIGRIGRSVFDYKQERTRTHISKLRLKVRIELLQDHIVVKLRTEGYENIFAQTVLSFDSNGSLEGTSLQRLSGHLYYLPSGTVTYRLGEDCIEVSGGSNQHRYAIMRNDKLDPGLLNVICNDVTPVERELHFRFKKISQDAVKERPL